MSVDNLAEEEAGQGEFRSFRRGWKHVLGRRRSLEMVEEICDGGEVRR